MMRRISWLALSSALYLSTQPVRAAEPAPAAPKPAPAGPKAAPAAPVAPKAAPTPAKPASKDAPAPSTAAAPPTEAELNKAQAAQRFDRGLQLFNEGDNAGALAEFKQTYALMPNPIVLFNIGLVYAAMGRPVDAVDALTPVVDSATLSPEQRERAQKTLSDQQQRIGRISVTSVPAGARIDVDGVEVARTPLSAPLRVAEGNHVIGAVAEGYAHAHKEILVAGNADASVNFELVLSTAKRPANLTIRSRITDAEVLIDDKSFGKTPLASSLALPAGQHTVELRRAGYQSGKQLVEVGESSIAEVTLDLAVDTQALAKEGADLTISVREPHLNLSVDREPLRLYTGTLRLPKGAHHLHLEQAGYLPFDQEITLDSQKPLLLTPYLLPTPEARKAHNDNVRMHRTWGWILTGAGAAVAGGGVTWLIVNSSKKSDALATYNHLSTQREYGTDNDPETKPEKGSACDLSGGGDFQQCNLDVENAQDAYDSAKARDIPGYVMIGVGAAALGTGIVLLVTGESAHRFDPPAKSAKSNAPSWAFAPGPGQLGLGLSRSF
ncbi:MAG TPA: PEGA domain-containing protein [Polyangiaceae bacterium]|jgi:tetratricopeptide (TPR) repeat protein|nr:PEGA domain-containing protein [Polyangiaceae bacterium]